MSSPIEYTAVKHALIGLQSGLPKNISNQVFKLTVSLQEGLKPINLHNSKPHINLLVVYQDC